jgi:hypothetical protein
LQHQEPVDVVDPSFPGGLKPVKRWRDDADASVERS